MLNPLFVKILRLWNFFWGCLLRFHYFISIFLSSQKSQESYYFCYSAICRLFVFPEFLQLLELQLFMINFIRCLISDFHFRLRSLLCLTGFLIIMNSICSNFCLIGSEYCCACCQSKNRFMNLRNLNFHFLSYSGYTLYLKYYLHFTRIKERHLDFSFDFMSLIYWISSWKWGLIHFILGPHLIQGHVLNLLATY